MIKGYSAYFVAYLLSNLKERESIERIILFGSAAKGEEDKESDIDIFIEVKKKTSKIKEEIFKLTEKFYQSRESSLFKLKGINQEFSIKIGILSEWKELEKSIASSGIVLYGPYESKKMPSGVKHFTIIFWDKIGKNRGAFLNKLYGFKVKDKSYDGLISKLSGKKLGKSCLMVPAQNKSDILRLIQEHKVQAKIIEVFVEN